MAKLYVTIIDIVTFQKFQIHFNVPQNRRNEPSTSTQSIIHV